MPTIYYKFSRTADSLALSNTATPTIDSFDISEFDGDSRGTARMADWADLESQVNSESAYDAFVDALGFTACDGGSSTNDQLIGWTSWNGTNRGNGNKYYYTDSNGSRSFYSVLNMTYGFIHDRNWFSATNATCKKNIGLGSWYGTRKILVYFPNYEANGGHTYLSVNNTTTTWSSSNTQFESADSSVTLKHNGSTWRITDNSNTYDASYNSADVGDYIDPASSDLTWQSGGSVSLVSAGASGDPHINPILGKPYII